MNIDFQAFLVKAAGRWDGLESLLTGPYSWLGLFYFLSLIAGATIDRRDPAGHRSRLLFWGLGLLLCSFTLLRPMTLGRDDDAYLAIGQGICPVIDCSALVSSGRDWVWYNLVGLARSLFDVPQAILTVAALGLLVKLWVIDRLCQQRLVALLLLFPLAYLQYDLTQLRAGLALSWFFVALYLLSRERFLAGGGLLLTNFLVHSQAIFSPMVLSYRLVHRQIAVAWLLMGGLLGLIYAGWFPSRPVLEFIGVPKFAPGYYQELVSGATASVKIFPAGYLLILAYAAWLSLTMPTQKSQLEAIVTASFLVGMVVAWFFALIPAMQCRIFEFYCAPLILLVGNMGRCRGKFVVTVLVASILYLRLELLNNWILG